MQHVLSKHQLTADLKIISCPKNPLLLILSIIFWRKNNNKEHTYKLNFANSNVNKERKSLENLYVCHFLFVYKKKEISIQNRLDGLNDKVSIVKKERKILFKINLLHKTSSFKQYLSLFIFAVYNCYLLFAALFRHEKLRNISFLLLSFHFVQLIWKFSTKNLKA